jgi:hypothetical protein
MRGRLVRGLRSAIGERALVAAVIAQALKDAQRGNAEAAAWLDEVGPGWCESFLGIDATAAADWRSADVGARPPADLEALRAADHERTRRYRERQRAKHTQSLPKVPSEQAEPDAGRVLTCA